MLNQKTGNERSIPVKERRYLELEIANLCADTFSGAASNTSQKLVEDLRINLCQVTLIRRADT